LAGARLAITQQTCHTGFLLILELVYEATRRTQELNADAPSPLRHRPQQLPSFRFCPGLALKAFHHARQEAGSLVHGYRVPW
jgi:hypothetical protein